MCAQDAATDTAEVGVSTDPDCLGPCEPGTRPHCNERSSFYGGLCHTCHAIPTFDKVFGPSKILLTSLLVKHQGSRPCK